MATNLSVPLLLCPRFVLSAINPFLKSPALAILTWAALNQTARAGPVIFCTILSIHISRANCQEAWSCASRCFCFTSAQCNVDVARRLWQTFFFFFLTWTFSFYVNQQFDSHLTRPFCFCLAWLLNQPNGFQFSFMHKYIFSNCDILYMRMNIWDALRHVEMSTLV